MKTIFKIGYLSVVSIISMIGLLLMLTLLPIPGNLKVKIVKSGSMEPTIKTGGIVAIKPESKYEIGDIVTFGKDTKTQIPTTHRIVSKSGNGMAESLTTKGDANDSVDPVPIKKSEILGKVVFSMPYVGYLLDYARRPVGFLLIVGIPAVLVIVDEIRKIFKEIRRIRAKKSNTHPGNLKEQNHRSLGGKNKFKENLLDLRKKNEVLKKEPKIQKKKEPEYSYLKFSIAVLAVITVSFSFEIGNTASYYREKESSVGNALRAWETQTILNMMQNPENPTSEDQKPLAIPANMSIIENVEESIISEELSDLNNDNIMDSDDTKKMPAEGEEVVETPAEGVEGEVPAEGAALAEGSETPAA